MKKPIQKSGIARLFPPIKDYCLITAGALLYAFTFHFFFEANGLAMGGFSGIGQILHRYFDFLTPGTVVFVLNLPLIAIGIKKMGLRLLFATVFATAVTSLFMNGMNLWTQRLGQSEIAMKEPLLACIFGGILCGVSLGLMMLKNATTGGTELAARLLKYVFRNLSIGRLCLAIDFTVVVFYALAYGTWEAALYGILAMYLAGITMDLVVYRSLKGKIACIISKKAPEIMEKLGEMDFKPRLLFHGISSEKVETPLLIYAAKPSRMAEIKASTMAIDPEAFLILSDIKEVYGEGFGSYGKDSL